MGIWYEDKRMDFYEITDEQVKRNSNCVAAIMLKNNLINEMNGFSTLKIKIYGEAHNLVETEPFRNQPVIAGSPSTGFLVQKDVVATAAQCVISKKITNFCIVFGYKMLDPTTPVIKVPNENIYSCVKILHIVYNSIGNKSSWALVQLDREVKNQEVAAISKDDISRDQSVYVIGHPMGLPLKYAAGGRVCDLKEALFEAKLDIYMGNGGSPVFDADTHEVIGIVTIGYNRDFRITDKGLASVIYPNRDIKSEGPQCTRISELIDYISHDYTDIDRKKVFISYSHKDKKYLERLLVHLRPLQKDGLIDLWVDTKLKAGDRWKIEIENALKRARAAILLVSADFLSSGFIVDNELPPLLKKAKIEGTRIIPVILKPCRFTRDKNLSIFQAINDPLKSIIKLSSAEREKIYDRIADEIEALMGE
jgi:V8-like Glu-specific endopeptidase